MLAKLRGFRTIIFGTVAAAAPLLLELLDAVRLIDISQWLTPRTTQMVLFGFGLAAIILRFATSTPVGKGDK